MGATWLLAAILQASLLILLHYRDVERTLEVVISFVQLQQLKCSVMCFGLGADLDPEHTHTTEQGGMLIHFLKQVLELGKPSSFYSVFCLC
jgi:hypothetical protein